MKKLLVTLIVAYAAVCSAYSQSTTIKGRVISNQLEPLIGVLITINDTVEVGKTDIDGFFKIAVPALEKRISFKFVGVDPTTIELADKCDEVEVVMMLRGTHDFVSLKKVDRLRREKFKKLPELHKEAFEKGLFKTEKPCYTQAFIPYCKKK